MVYPTDTAYGLGVDATRASTVKKIFAIKGRSAEKAVSVSVKNIDMAWQYAVLSQTVRRFLKRVWPGAVTVILKGRSTLPKNLTAGANAVGLRWPDHPFHEALFRFIDFPITATSANISGEKPSRDPKDVAAALSGGVIKPDLIVNIGKLKRVSPSTVIDLTGAKPKILREGPVKAKLLIALLKNYISSPHTRSLTRHRL